jgi:hypothetical protein
MDTVLIWQTYYNKCYLDTWCEYETRTKVLLNTFDKVVFCPDVMRLVKVTLTMQRTSWKKILCC